MQPLTKASNSSEITQRELDNLKVAYAAACEGIVLLKNDGALPFQHNKIALYGPGASMTIKGGTGSGEVNERHSVSILEGLEDRGFQITTRQWIRAFEENYQQQLSSYKEARKKEIDLFHLHNIMGMLAEDFKIPVGPAITDADVEGSDTDFCVYVLSRQAGEGRDRKTETGDYYLTDDETRDILFCAEHYAKFVLVINCGGFIDLSFTEKIPGINAIVYISQLGTEGGHAFADVLSGQVTPSGKLADTWAKRYEDIPFSDTFSDRNGDLINEDYCEGIYVGYRYFDSFNVTPAFPFGFGLSYTDFSIRCTDIQIKGRTVTVYAEVTNTGKEFSGKEVVQLYVSAPAGTLHKEYQSLAAFAKTDTLSPGGKQTLELEFDPECIASYRESDSCFILEQGNYILRLGDSSRNTSPVGVLILEQEIILSRHQRVCPPTRSFSELKSPVRTEKLDPELPRIPLSPAEFITVEHQYRTPEIHPDTKTAQILDSLSVPDMTHLLVGIGMFGGKPRFNLPGSVGNTTDRFWKKGLVNVALCDGPAGLRIQKRSTIDRRGTIKPVDMGLEMFNYFPGFIKKIMTGDPRRNTVIYQYTTAFPVSSALAQTWNIPLMEQVGKAIQTEMKEYGCTFWLAPAVNIHRNPLCGRNFEYFSEDPRLTGLMACAITQGVQQEEGFYVTVKHFACNNQENNRNYVSSNLSERALREIYLRAFRETVQKGNVRSIMSSYNKINGVYACNSHDLLTKVLRSEWGFDGIVMTDWFSTGGKKADTARCIRAGNDLIMPGGYFFRKELMRAFRSGMIGQEDLKRCSANLIKLILNSAIQKEYIG